MLIQKTPCIHFLKSQQFLFMQPCLKTTFSCWIRPDYIAVIATPMGILSASGFICYGLIWLQKTADQFPGKLFLKLIFGFDANDFVKAKERNSKPAKKPNPAPPNEDNPAPPNEPNSDPPKEPNSNSNKFSSSFSRLGFIHLALAFPFVSLFLPIISLNQGCFETGPMIGTETASLRTKKTHGTRTRL